MGVKSIVEGALDRSDGAGVSLSSSHIRDRWKRWRLPCGVLWRDRTLEQSQSDCYDHCFTDLPHSAFAAAVRATGSFYSR